MFEENDICLSSRASAEASKNWSWGVLGFRIAHCARRIRSVTRGFSNMGSPKLIRRGCGSTLPSLSVTIRSETTHRQGSEECESWHSVGHLCAQGAYSRKYREAGRAYLVQVPDARGRVIPDMASIRDDFPALCDPRTAMTGMSRSNCALREKRNI